MGLLDEFKQFQKIQTPVGEQSVAEEFSAFQGGEGGGVSVIGTEEEVLTPAQITEQRLKERGFTVPTEQPKGFIGEAVGDITETFGAIGERFEERGAGIAEAIRKGTRGEFNPLVSGIVTVGEVAGAFGDVVGEGFIGLGKLLVSEDVEQSVKDTFQRTIEESGAGQALTGGFEKWQEFKRNNPQTAESIEGIANIADAFLEFTGVGVTGKVVRETAEEVGEIALRTGTRVFEKAKKTSIFGKEIDVPKNVDALVKEVDDLVAKGEDLGTSKRLEEVTTGLRKEVERQAPKLNIKERYLGIREDIKAQIQGKASLLKSYFEMIKASNKSLNVNTINDFNQAVVTSARNKLRETLDDVGSAIGQTRRKLATTKVPLEKLDEVIKVFDEQLSRLNLERSELGEIVVKKGRVSPIRKQELPVYNEIWQDLKRMKQSPTVESIIDNRIALDGKINFAKRAGDVSGSIDPIARRLRSSLAKINETAVGKTGAKNLKDYSETITNLKDLDNFIDKKAGSEYLLRLLLSGRGREARDLVKRIREITGIDLMDHAVMTQIAVELLGNDTTKNLFRQGIEKGATDAISTALNLGSGGVSGALQFLFKKGEGFLKSQKRIEEQFLKSAK